MSEKKNKSLRRQEDVRLLDEEVFEEFEDEEDFDSDVLIDDKLDYVDYIADKLEKQSVESFSDNKATQPVIDEKNVSVSEKSTGAEASE